MSKDDWKKDAVKTGVGIAAGVALTDAYLKNEEAKTNRRMAKGNEVGLDMGLSRAAAALLGWLWAYPLGILSICFIIFILIAVPVITAIKYVSYGFNSVTGQRMLPANPEPWLKKQLTFQSRVIQTPYNGPDTEHTTLTVAMTNPTNIDLGSFQVNCIIRHEMDSHDNVIVLHGGPVPAHSTRTYSSVDDSAGTGEVLDKHCRITEVTPAHDRWWEPLPRR
jgi:hypothetical protein